MDQLQVSRHVLEDEGPVHGRIPPSHNQDPLAPIGTRILHGVVDSPPQELSVSGTLQSHGLEGSLATGQDEGAGESTWRAGP
jgi:hypothetical protein